MTFRTLIGQKENYSVSLILFGLSLSNGIMRRDALQIKKDILSILSKEGELTLRELDIKVNTNYQTIRKQVRELEYFGKVMIIKHPKSEKTGRPYTTVKIKK